MKKKVTFIFSHFITRTIIPVDGGLRLLSQEGVAKIMKDFSK